MRLLWLPLILLLARPAAADTPTLIPLHHVSASVFERYLMPGGEHLQGNIHSFDGSHDLLPAGITAWTIDERRNALRVTGSDDAIADLKRIVERLDVPAREGRISTRVVRMDAEEAARLQGEPLPSPTRAGDTTDLVVIGGQDQVVALELRTALAASEMTVTNNHPLHLLWTGDHSQPSAWTDISPRVNGDSSVTLFVSLDGPPSSHGPGPARIAVLRRIAAGRAVAVFSPSLGTTLIVRVQAVLPGAWQAGP